MYTQTISVTNLHDSKILFLVGLYALLGIILLPNPRELRLITNYINIYQFINL